MGAFAGVALIVGAGSADGQAVSAQLVEAGCSRVVLADADIDALQTAEATCRELGKDDTNLRILARQCDPQVPGSLDALTAAIIEAFGELNYCANCLRPQEVFEDYDVSEMERRDRFKAISHAWQRSVWLCMHAEIKCMMRASSAGTKIQEGHGTSGKRHQASIVNISAVQGLASEAGFGPFCAAAHGIVGFTRATAMDYLKEGIRLNCVCPRPLAAGSGSISPPGDEHSSRQGKSGLPPLPHGRQVTSKDVAHAVCFMLSPDAMAITGVELPVDCGWSLFHY